MGRVQEDLAFGEYHAIHIAVYILYCNGHFPFQSNDVRRNGANTDAFFLYIYSFNGKCEDPLFMLKCCFFSSFHFIYAFLCSKEEK